MSSKQANILYLLHSFHTRAGTEEHVKTMLGGLSPNFNIYVAFCEGNQLILRMPDGQEGADVGCPSSWPVAPAPSEQFDKSFDKILTISNPDLIHIHHLNNWPLHTIERIAELNIKKIMTFHDYFALTPLVSGGISEEILRSPKAMLTEQYSTLVFGSDISEFLRNRRLVLEKLVLSLDLRIAPSKFVAEIMSSALQSQFQVIEHGIEPFNTQPKVAEPPLRFGFIGSLIPQKGWTVLAEAFYKLREKFSDIELHMFGGDASSVVQIPGLTFHGLYDRQTLPTILTKFHVGVVPSVFAETYCLSLSELWMGKLPVIASEIGALRSRITNNIDGLFFKPGDVQDLVSKMEWFCTHDEWRSWQIPVPRLATAMIEDYRTIYNSLVDA